MVYIIICIWRYVTVPNTCELGSLLNSDLVDDHPSLPPLPPYLKHSEDDIAGGSFFDLEHDAVVRDGGGAFSASCNTIQVCFLHDGLCLITSFYHYTDGATSPSKRICPHFHIEL